MIEVKPVATKSDLEAFIEFPFRLYRNDPYWVPPLKSERRAFFDPRRNPFYEHADIQLFRAVRDGETVGTIAGIINHNHNAFHNEKTGFFGIFEVIEDYSVAEALLATARDWVRAKGMTILRGPMNFSTNEECGLLVDGFDSSPMVFMTYNPRYYVDFIERFGFTKAMDLWAYSILRAGLQTADDVSPKLSRVVKKVRERINVTIRTVDMPHFDQELAMVKKLYNSAWSKNWGFVPMTEAEIDHLAQGIKRFLDPDLALVAEVDGKPVGFALTLPDINQALMRVRGRLFPLGWLYYLLDRRKINACRIFALGVVEEYRGRGIDALLYYETARAALKKGYIRGEMSWILENNDMMNRAIRMMGGQVYKTYRVYDLPL